MDRDSIVTPLFEVGLAGVEALLEQESTKILVNITSTIASFFQLLRDYLPFIIDHHTTVFLKLPGNTAASHQTNAPTACQRHCGLCIAAAANLLPTPRRSSSISMAFKWSAGRTC